MFLLEGPFGRILHTGDFRWEADFAAGMLRDEVLTWAPLDQLYIDNTYAHPRQAPDLCANYSNCSIAVPCSFV